MRGGKRRTGSRVRVLEMVFIGNWEAASIPRNIQEYLESGEAEQTFVVAYDMMQRRLPVS